MKLRLQLASRVSAPVKPGPTEAHGKSGFGATMQELMAMPLSGKPTLPQTAQALVSAQSSKSALYFSVLDGLRGAGNQAPD